MYLVEHADRVVGKDEALQTLWPEPWWKRATCPSTSSCDAKRLCGTNQGRGSLRRFQGRATVCPSASDRAVAHYRPMVVSAAESIVRITPNRNARLCNRSRPPNKSPGQARGRGLTYLGNFSRMRTVRSSESDTSSTLSRRSGSIAGRASHAWTVACACTLS
jgi:hypothetical protein